MAWNDIIGQHRVKNVLQKAIKENRIANSYCFSGIEGIGKEAIAIEFAKTVNCLSPVNEEGEISACGICDSCKQFRFLQHPNLTFIYSLPAGKSSDSKSDSSFSKLSEEQIEEIQAQFKLKAKDYYHKIAIANASQIKIASIRELKKSLSLSQMQAGRRVIIVLRADELSKESANSFLKTLEEPNKDVTIILITARQDQILPTILSRCQQIIFQPLSQDELEQLLINKQSVGKTDAKLFACFAQGSYQAALEFLNEDIKKLRKDAVDLLRTALRKRVYRYELASRIDDILASKDKKKYIAVLLHLLVWLRDASTVSLTGNINFIVNIDQKEDIQSFAKNFGSKNLIQAIELIEKSISQVNKNVQNQLIFLNLFLKLRKILLF